MNQPSGNGKPKYSAPAAGCAADLMLALARGDSELSINELAGRTGCTKSLVYRVLTELEARDLVSKLDNGNYGLGLAVVELGGAFSASVPLMSSVRGVCRRLADLTGETVNLGILQGDQVLYLMREEGARSVFAVSHVGKLLPANAVALGKALLALKSDDAVAETFAERLAREGQLSALTPKTITTLDELISELARVREQGHAEEHGEAVIGRCCIAATAPFDQHNIASVAISVSMDETRFRETRETMLGALLQARDQVARQARGRAAIGEAPSRTEVVIGGLSSGTRAPTITRPRLAAVDREQRH
jgi:DNA-binding IclR family transcriptional regulator